LAGMALWEEESQIYTNDVDPPRGEVIRRPEKGTFK